MLAFFYLLESLLLVVLIKCLFGVCYFVSIQEKKQLTDLRIKKRSFSIIFFIFDICFLNKINVKKQIL